jgi:hypothetical protein
MAGTDGDEPVDVLDTGEDRMPWLQRRGPRLGVGALVGVLLIGLLVGYVAGRDHGHTTRATPPAVASASPSPPPSAASIESASLSATGEHCSLQQGRHLILGIEVSNGTAADVRLGRLHARLPLGGLRAIGSAHQTCGQTPAPPGSIASAALAPGASTWLTMTFDVLVKCPSALPVLFRLSYLQLDRPGSVELGGFVDLGSVPYTGCRPAR